MAPGPGHPFLPACRLPRRGAPLVPVVAVVGLVLQLQGVVQVKVWRVEGSVLVSMLAPLWAPVMSQLQWWAREWLPVSVPEQREQALVQLRHARG